MNISESQTILTKINSMNRKELDTFIDAAVARRKYLSSQANINAAMTFRIGDKVRFDAKRRGIIEITIESISGGNLKGRQNGARGINWKVSSSLCTKI
jgi:hypothetical protein